MRIACFLLVWYYGDYSVVQGHPLLLQKTDAVKVTSFKNEGFTFLPWALFLADAGYSFAGIQWVSAAFSVILTGRIFWLQEGESLSAALYLILLSLLGLSSL